MEIYYRIEFIIFNKKEYILTAKAITILTEKKDKKNKRMPDARLPTEVEYWYVLPVVRKELAKKLKEIGNLRQKEVADILGISESAVSQYLKGTRAGLEDPANGVEIEIPDWLHEEITASANRILANKNNRMLFLKEINNLLFIIRAKPTAFLCKVHRAFGIAEKDCLICVEQNNLINAN